jgi:uncharacterized protein YjdB
LLAAGSLFGAVACNDDTPADPIRVASVDVTPKLSNARVGTTQQLTAVARDASGNAMSGESVTWSSSEPSVATVSAGGLVTFVGNGSTAIIATARGTTGFATIVSDGNVAQVTLSATLVSVSTPQTFQLTATPKDAAGNALFRPVTWTSSAPTVATVSSTGLISSVSAGTTTITATSEGKTATATVTITQPLPVATVAIAPNTGFLPTGVAVPLAVTLRDANNGILVDPRVVTWTTSAAGVATVSATGVVSAVATGNVTITATSEGKNGTAAFQALTGLKNATGITFSNATASTQVPFAVYIPSGTTTLRITLAGGTGDPDLYLYKPGNTNLAADDCHSFNDGPAETCTVTNPASGVWLVLVDAYIPHAGTTILATITPTPP